MRVCILYFAVSRKLGFRRNRANDRDKFRANFSLRTSVRKNGEEIDVSSHDDPQREKVAITLSQGFTGISDT